ncbi:MAG: hypothetical protein QM756_04145 [Polyangiaceae bacterium]
MSHHTEEVRVRGAESQRVIGPEADDSAVVGDFSYAAGVAQGTVRWASTCRQALMQSESIDVWHTKKPMYGAATGALLAGAAVGVGSTYLLANAHNYSSLETNCSEDQYGNQSCSSPREAAIAVGLTGAVVSLLAVSAGIATYAAHTERTRGESLPQPDRLVEIVGRNVACGFGPVVGLGVSVFRAEERVSASVTNAAGQVAFALPPHVTGELSIVVDSVPPELQRIREGDSLGSVTVPAPEPAPGG